MRNVLLAVLESTRRPNSIERPIANLKGIVDLTNTFLAATPPMRACVVLVRPDSIKMINGTANQAA